MALTTEQRNSIYNSVQNYLNALAPSTKFTIGQIIANLPMEDVSVMTVANYLNNFATDSVMKTGEKRGNSVVWEKIAGLDFIFDYDITMTKERNILTIVNNHKESSIQYDFIKRKFILNDNTEKEIEDIVYRDNGRIFWALTEILKKENSLEWLFNYIDRYDSCIGFIKNTVKRIDWLPTTMPQGYISHIRENEPIDYADLSKYMNELKYGKFGVNLIESLGESRFLSILNKQLFDFNDVVKCLAIDIKHGCWYNICNRIEDLYDYCNELMVDYNTTFIIDTNRGLLYNIERASELHSQNRYKNLADNLKKINDVNNTVILDDYIAIVPQGIKDLQNEGRMQNNCVGHYYNERIERGGTYICFLRKKDTPSQSYITCRYDAYYHRLVEYRYKNNYGVTLDKDRDALAQLEKLINKISNL